MANSIAVCFLLFAVAYLHVAMGHQDKTCSLDDRKHHIGFCGVNFANVLSMLCGKGGGGYNKRNSQDFQQDSAYGNGLNEDGGLEYFLPKSAAISLIHADLKRSVRWNSVNNMNVFTGAMCECCHNQCSITELAQYCKDPQKAMAGITGNFG